MAAKQREPARALDMGGGPPGKMVGIVSLDRLRAHCRWGTSDLLWRHSLVTEGNEVTLVWN